MGFLRYRMQLIDALRSLTDGTLYRSFMSHYGKSSIID